MRGALAYTASKFSTHVHPAQVCAYSLAADAQTAYGTGGGGGGGGGISRTFSLAQKEQKGRPLAEVEVGPANRKCSYIYILRKSQRISCRTKVHEGVGA